MSVVTNKMRESMRAMDAQVDAKEHAKKYSMSNVEKGVAEGVEIARRIQEETARMVDAYESFVEERLKVIIGALGCSPEDLTLLTYDAMVEHSPGLFTTRQDILYRDYPIMKLERIMVDATNIQFIATPLTEDEEGL